MIPMIRIKFLLYRLDDELGNDEISSMKIMKIILA